MVSPPDVTESVGGSVPPALPVIVHLYMYLSMSGEQIPAKNPSPASGGEGEQGANRRKLGQAGVPDLPILADGEEVQDAVDVGRTQALDGAYLGQSPGIPLGGIGGRFHPDLVV